jgi:hypothetical protein
MHFPQVLQHAALHASLIFALAAKSASYTRDALVVSIGMHFLCLYNHVLARPEKLVAQHQ